MADSKRNTIRKDHIEQSRNQRTTPPNQPGASASPEVGASEDEARNRTLHRLGKTDKHTSSDRDLDSR